MVEAAMTWQEFLHEATDFLNRSNRLKDTWFWQQNNDDEGGGFLVYKQKIPMPKKLDRNQAQQPSESCLTEKANEIVDSCYRNLLQMEYHVVYSISYQVPVLYFLAHKDDGSILDMEEAWSLFHDDDDIDARIVDNNHEHPNNHGHQQQLNSSKSRSDMLSILTQMDHPVLCRPFLALHPCRTAKLLAQNGVSGNRVLTFISLMGPFVQIQLPNEYGLEN